MHVSVRGEDIVVLLALENMTTLRCTLARRPGAVERHPEDFPRQLCTVPLRCVCWLSAHELVLGREDGAVLLYDTAQRQWAELLQDWSVRKLWGGLVGTARPPVLTMRAVALSEPARGGAATRLLLVLLANRDLVACDLESGAVLASCNARPAAADPLDEARRASGATMADISPRPDGSFDVSYVFASPPATDDLAEQPLLEYGFATFSPRAHGLLPGVVGSRFVLHPCPLRSVPVPDASAAAQERMAAAAAGASGHARPAAEAHERAWWSLCALAPRCLLLAAEGAAVAPAATGLFPRTLMLLDAEHDPRALRVWRVGRLKDPAAAAWHPLPGGHPKASQGLCWTAGGDVSLVCLSVEGAGAAGAVVNFSQRQPALPLLHPLFARATARLALGYALLHEPAAAELAACTVEHRLPEISEPPLNLLLCDARSPGADASGDAAVSLAMPAARDAWTAPAPSAKDHELVLAWLLHAFTDSAAVSVLKSSALRAARLLLRDVLSNASAWTPRGPLAALLRYGQFSALLHLSTHYPGHSGDGLWRGHVLAGAACAAAQQRGITVLASQLSYAQRAEEHFRSAAVELARSSAQLQSLLVVALKLLDACEQHGLALQLLRTLSETVGRPAATDAQPLLDRFLWSMPPTSLQLLRAAIKCSLKAGELDVALAIVRGSPAPNADLWECFVTKLPSPPQLLSVDLAAHEVDFVVDKLPPGLRQLAFDILVRHGRFRDAARHMLMLQHTLLTSSQPLDIGTAQRLAPTLAAAVTALSLLPEGEQWVDMPAGGSHSSAQRRTHDGALAASQADAADMPRVLPLHHVRELHLRAELAVLCMQLPGTLTVSLPAFMNGDAAHVVQAAARCRNRRVRQLATTLCIMAGVDCAVVGESLGALYARSVTSAPASAPNGRGADAGAQPVFVPCTASEAQELASEMQLLLSRVDGAATNFSCLRAQIRAMLEVEPGLALPEWMEDMFQLQGPQPPLARHGRSLHPPVAVLLECLWGLGLVDRAVVVATRALQVRALVAARPRLRATL